MSNQKVTEAETPQPIRILVIDDDKNVRRSVEAVIEDAGYQVKAAENAIQAMERLRAETFDLLVVDIRIGEISGLQLVEKLRTEGYQMPVLFISGHASLTEAVEAIRMGAADFLEKPFEPERLLLAVARVLRIGELERRLRDAARKQARGEVNRRFQMIGESRPMLNLWQAIEKVGPTKSKVLIQGESGTGKELIARALHELSPVAGGPFIKVNCAAIPSELIESELFGHERGAFTGATQFKKGQFEVASGGTIFLDEIGEMSPSAQAKVLRVLQSQEMNRVGGTVVVKVDVRVIAATNRDLQVEIKEGRFREDLFFRLNVVPIRSLPLRERREDIPVLLTAFIRRYCEDNHLRPKTVSPEALEKLMAHSWPGNVRELENLAERLVIFAGETVELKDLPDELMKTDGFVAVEPTRMSAVTPSESLHDYKKKMEREFLIKNLKKSNGSISQAARFLDIERTYLHRKILEHDIKKAEYF